MRPNVTLDLGLRYEYTPPWLDVKGEMMNIWVPPGFGTPSQQGKPCFIRVGSGDPYEGVATRFDPAICVARDGRLGDRLIASRQDELCAPHRRGVEPIAEDDRANRLRHFLRAGFDQPGLRHEPKHPGAHYGAEFRADARAALRRRRNEPLRCSDAAAGVCHGAAGPGQSIRPPHALRRTVPPQLPAGSKPQHGRGDRVLWQPRAPPAAVHLAEPAGAWHEHFPSLPVLPHPSWGTGR